MLIDNETCLCQCSVCVAPKLVKNRVLKLLLSFDIGKKGLSTLR
jgi:hypothetical protein